MHISWRWAGINWQTPQWQDKRHSRGGTFELESSSRPVQTLLIPTVISGLTVNPGSHENGETIGM